MGRDEGGEGDLVVGERLEEVFRVEAHHVVGHDRSPHPRVDEGVVEGVDVAAGHDEEGDVVEVEVVVEDHDEVLGKRDRWLFMTPFGLPVVPLVYMMIQMSSRSTYGGRLLGACRSHGVLVGRDSRRNAGLSTAKEMYFSTVGRFFFIPLAMSIHGNSLPSLGPCPLHEKDLAFAVVDVVLHLGRGKPEHDGHDDEAALCGGRVDLHPLHAVVAEGREPVALLHAHVRQGHWRAGRSARSIRLKV